ncbi:MAG TPA: hypothetical protein VH143_11995 [Kofleriaceae bacterium]|jgi:uncharacterized OsmC-like protein|nr:hypothetical protein [Kofleriaceae bacterium]
MKLLGFILAILLLLATAFVTLAAANKSHHLASDIATIAGQLGGGDSGALAKQLDLPSPMRLNVAALIGALGGIASLILLIAAFAKKSWVGALSVLTIGCAAITAALYPHIETGAGDGAAPRPMALIAIGLAAVGALGAYMATKRDRA